MTQPTRPRPLPAWVTKRDGRLAPFEADKISRSLFAATEALGRPDAFLARELADGVLHFLAADAEGATPTTAQVAELVAKVVRELGQPALAQAYAEYATRPARPAGRPPAPGPAPGPSPDQVARWVEDEPSAAGLAWRVSRAALRGYALREVFTRDLVAAQADGLLTLGGLEAPRELSAMVLGPFTATAGWMLEAVEQAREAAGTTVAIDGLDHLLGRATDPDAASACVAALGFGLRAAGLAAVLNVRCATPPPWAGELAEGPLFAAGPAETGQGAGSVDALPDRWTAGGLPGRLDWHLAGLDFEPAGAARLLHAARRAAAGAAVAFTFDRPRRPVPLGEGLDRRHPVVLMTVGLHLPRLAAMPGLGADPALFLQKLGSLARLALGAGAQKRDYLRRHGRPAVGRGFLLDRARLVVVPVGLEAVVRQLVGRGPCEGPAGLDFGRQVVQRLAGVLVEDAPTYGLEGCLDSADGFAGGEPEAVRADAPRWAAGLTAWDPLAPPRQQVRAAGALHAVAGAGTAAVLVSAAHPPGPEEVADLLRYAWQHTDVVRLRLVRTGEPPRQLTAPWEG